MSIPDVFVAIKLVMNFGKKLEDNDCITRINHRITNVFNNGAVI